MKLFKMLIITLVSVLLTGCYTQLQYSQSMKKITDEKQPKETGVYSWSGEERAEQPVDNEKKTANNEQYDDGEEYIPVYYKDYEYATKYGNVYNVNNYFGNDWYGYNYYRPYPMYRSFYYDRWLYRNHFGHWYNTPRYGFSLTIGWGRPYHYRSFYDPFFDPYYNYYWHGYYSPYAFNYNYFYRKSGYGFGYLPDSKKRADQNMRYGPRAIGTNRVATDGNRSRTINGDRSAEVTNRTSSTVRTRSVGTTRTRGNTNSSSVDRAKSRDNNASSQRSRTRDNIQVDNSKTDDYNYRSRNDERPLVIDKKRLEEIRTRNNRASNRLINRARLDDTRDGTPTFFNRMKNFFQESTGNISNGNSGKTLRTRSNFPSTTINRKASSTNRSSVTKSNSSSSNSRSRGNNSSSRSRSDNSSSSSSDRSRGN